MQTMRGDLMTAKPEVLRQDVVSDFTKMEIMEDKDHSVYKLVDLNVAF